MIFIHIWNLRKIDVKNGSATKLPFEDSAFDTVYSSHVLEHIENDVLAAKEIIRVAKHKSIVIVPEGNCDDKNLGTPHLRYYDRKSFKLLIEEATSGIECEMTFRHHAHSLINSLIAEVDLK